MPSQSRLKYHQASGHSFVISHMHESRAVAVELDLLHSDAVWCFWEDLDVD